MRGLFLFLFIDLFLMSSAPPTALRCAASLSTQPRWQDALHEAVGGARESLGGIADLAVLFLSPHHAAAADEIAEKACDLIGTSNLLGCTGEAIAGTARELEEQ